MFKDHYFSHSKEITRIRSIGGLSLTPAPLKTLIVASLILIAPLVSHPSLASTPVILTSETSEIKLNRHCDYFLEDSLAATSQPPSQATFQPITHDNLALGFSNKTVWLKCSFISHVDATQSESSKDWWIQVLPAALQSVTIYHPDGTIYKNGSSVPYLDKKIQAPTSIFQIWPPNNTESTYFIRIHSKTTLSPQLTLYDSTQFITAQFWEAAILGIFLGLLIIAAFVNGAYGVIFRDFTIATFTLSLVFSGLLSLSLSGWSIPLFFRYWPNGYYLFHGFFVSSGIATLVWSFYDLLETKKISPKTYQVIRWLRYSLFGCSLTSFFGLYYGWPNVFVRLASTVGMIPALVIGYRQCKTGRTQFKYYFAGILLFFIFLALGQLNGFGIFAITGAATQMPRIGAGIYAVLVTIGIIFKVREIDLARERLESEKVASIRALGQLGHEIRTPLNAIANLARIALSQTNMADVFAKLLTIHRETKSVLDVTNTLLNYSQVSDKSLIIAKCDFNLKGLVKELCQLYTPIAAEKGLYYGCEVDPEIPNLVHSDPVRIRQILNNVLNNAVKFTDRGSIRLEAKQIDRSVRITVSNSVCDTPSVLDSQTSSAKLGLSISADLAERLGGSLIFSTPEKKNRIQNKRDDEDQEFSESVQYVDQINEAVFWLPITLSPAALPVQTHAQLSTVEAWIVEDNPVNLEITEAAVRAAGLTFRSFTTAEETLKVAMTSEQSFPALAIIDIHLDLDRSDSDDSKLYGLDLARQLREHSSKTVLIALTGESAQERSEWQDQSPFDQIWTKPLAFDQAVLELSRIVSRNLQSQIPQEQEKAFKPSEPLMSLIHPNMTSAFLTNEDAANFLNRVTDSLTTTVNELDSVLSSRESNSSSDSTGALLARKTRLIGLAHKLKSTASSVTDQTLVKLTEEIETLIKNESEDEARLRIPGIRHRIDLLPNDSKK